MKAIGRFAITPKWSLLTINMNRSQINANRPLRTAAAPASTSANNKQVRIKATSFATNAPSPPPSRKKKGTAPVVPNLDKLKAQAAAATVISNSQKFGEIAYSIFDQYSHMDEVRDAQFRVTMIQDKLAESQQKRAALMNKLTAIQKEHKKLHNELLACSRNDPQYREILEKVIEVGRTF